MSLLRAALQHLRSYAGTSLLLSVVVLVVCAISTGLPRVVERVATTDLRTALDGLSDVQRDLSSSAIGGVPPDTVATEPFSGLRGDLEALSAELPAEVGRPGTPGFGLRLPPIPGTDEGVRRRVELIGLSDLEQLRLIEGRFPEPARLPAYVDNATRTDGRRTRIEVVVSAATASRMNWEVGERIPLTGFSELQEIGIMLFAPLERTPASVVLVGVFEAVDPSDRTWDHVASVLEPFVFDDGNQRVQVTAAAVAHPSLFTRANSGVRLDTWIPLDTPDLDLSEPQAVSAGLRQFTSQIATLSSSESATTSFRVKFSTETSATIDRATTRAVITRSVLAVVNAGPIALAVVVLLIGVVLLRLRQRPALTLLASRGASSPQILGLGIAQGVLIGVPAGLIGLGIGTWTVPLDTPAPPAYAVVAGLAAAPAIALPLAMFLGLPGRRMPLAWRSARAGRRVIAELSVAVVAGACFLALTTPAADTPAQPDFFVAAAPAVLSLLASLLAWRLTQMMLGSLATRWRQGPGLVAAVGSARARRESVDGVTIVISTALATAVAVLSVIVLRTLDATVAVAADLAASNGTTPSVPPDSPGLAGLTAVLVVAVALSFALMLIATLLAAAVTRPARERLFATLAVVGTSRRQLRGLALWEIVPAALAGVTAGVTVGSAPILLRALDVAAYAGLEDAAASRPGAEIGVLVTVFVVALVGARLLVAARAGRADPAPIFRDPAPGGG